MIKNIVTGTTGNYENELKKFRLAFEKSDAVIIGAGSGLSGSAGAVLYPRRFRAFPMFKAMLSCFIREPIRCDKPGH